MPPGERVLDGDDVAGLVLADGEGLPGGARPLRLEDRRDTGQVRMFGPRLDRPQGGYVDGRVMGLVADGRLQVDERVVGVFQVGRGWSGGPVRDRLTGKVAGLLVAAPADESHVDVYAIPTRTLVDAWPEALGGLLIPPNPYQGLRPFGRGDRGRFFGREQVVEEMIPELHRQGMVAVVGPSGSGKSSVVHGGVVPLLEADGWLIMPFRPESRPREALAAAFARAASPGGAVLEDLALERWEQRIAGEGIAGALRVLSQLRDADRIVLVADQFEEIASLASGGETVEFLDLLGALVDAPPPRPQTRLILTLRDDWWGRLVCAHERFGELLRRHARPLRPMEEAELMAAVTTPAHDQGVTFEDALIRRIVREVAGRPGDLPLLSLTLERLWDRQWRGHIDQGAYEAVGTVAGVLEQYAHRVLDGFDKTENAAARRVLTALVIPGSDGLRRRVRRSELRVADWSVAVRLADARLLVTARDDTAQEESVEPAHEALLRWQQLQQWHDEDREFLGWADRTRRRQEEWNGAGQDSSLLLAGPLIAEASAWLERRPEDSPPFRAFVQSSEAHRVAEEERFRLLAQEARRNLAQAEALQLAAQADLVHRTHRDGAAIALRLAVESLRTMPTLQGDQALRQALRLVPTHVARVAHDGWVWQVAFSPDGTLLATAGDRIAWAVHLPQGAELTRVAHNGQVRGVAFSPDGTLLATAGGDGGARVNLVRPQDLSSSLRPEAAATSRRRMEAVPSRRAERAEEGLV